MAEPLLTLDVQPQGGNRYDLANPTRRMDAGMDYNGPLVEQEIWDALELFPGDDVNRPDSLIIQGKLRSRSFMDRHLVGRESLIRFLTQSVLPLVPAGRIEFYPAHPGAVPLGHTRLGQATRLLFGAQDYDMVLRNIPGDYPLEQHKLPERRPGDPDDVVTWLRVSPVLNAELPGTRFARTGRSLTHQEGKRLLTVGAPLLAHPFARDFMGYVGKQTTELDSPSGGVYARSRALKLASRLYGPSADIENFTRDPQLGGRLEAMIDPLEAARYGDPLSSLSPLIQPDERRNRALLYSWVDGMTRSAWRMHHMAQLRRLERDLTAAEKVIGHLSGMSHTTSVARGELFYARKRVGDLRASRLKEWRDPVWMTGRLGTLHQPPARANTGLAVQTPH